MHLDKLFMCLAEKLYIKTYHIHKHYLYRHAYKYTCIYFYVNVLKDKYII